VLGAEIHEGDKMDAGDFLDVALIAGGDAVSERLGDEAGEGETKQCCGQGDDQPLRVPRRRVSLARMSVRQHEAS